MGEIKRLGETPLTIDEQIALHEAEMAQYNLVPQELSNVRITITCLNCKHKRVEELGRYVDGNCYPSASRCWEIGCGAFIEPPTLDDIERLIADARKHVDKP